MLKDTRNITHTHVRARSRKQTSKQAHTPNTHESPTYIHTEDKQMISLFFIFFFFTVTVVFFAVCIRRSLVSLISQKLIKLFLFLLVPEFHLKWDLISNFWVELFTNKPGLLWLSKEMRIFSSRIFQFDFNILIISMAHFSVPNSTPLTAYSPGQFFFIFGK